VWLDADKFGHEVLREPDVVRAVVERWGTSVVKKETFSRDSERSGEERREDTETRRREDAGKNTEGKREEGRGKVGGGSKAENTELDRAVIAKIVFEESAHGAAELEWLEQLSHPRIRAKLEQRISELRAKNCPMVIMDAPVMLKTGWDKICDRVIYVHATKEVRVKRALARGWSKEQFEKREAAQESLEVKRARADFVLDNSGDSEYTEKQLDQLWQNLLK
jgi:dephospho-CoA kinase